MSAKLIVSYAIREILGLVVMGVALFWSAGKVNWWPAWAALAVMAAWIVATAIVIFRTNPALLTERLSLRKGAKSWDITITSILALAQLLRYIVAGLDQRYNWTGELPVIVQIIALFACALGYALLVWAIASNVFFSQVVRIQTERGHTVVSSGPYRYVRHPGYAGAILYELSVSILLASWWSFIFSGLGAILLILRTALEDRTLLAELPGYKDYSHNVRYRLIPKLW